MQEEITSEIKIAHRPFVRWSLLTAGTVLVGIGILGIFLPLLPTTVFFLMAAWCYARSSRRFYEWLHHNKYFGKYIKNYREGKGISVSSKISTIVVLWGGILYSIFVTQSLVLGLILVAIAIGVTIHIIVIPTHRSE
ncbi:MAG: YbaN family protein [Ignavibacteriales bacterium]|nr:YbaN family protein [Ignavibacteriales bacterium]